MFCVLLGLTTGASAQDNAEASAFWTQATLYRDTWGVPHVYAENPQALGFAFGYAQAEDHLEDMLMAYRIAKGRAAEVLGESMAASDATMLRLGHARLAQAALPALDPVVAGLCAGFAQGANAWIAEHPQQTPAWAEGVSPADPIALWHAYTLSLAPIDAPGIHWPALAAPTGNAWALAPQRTVEGKAVLVMNPHADYATPFQWYEAHLVCGSMDMAGVTLFGLPILVMGHTPVLGWALTPNAPDFADVADETPAANLPEDDKKAAKEQRAGQAWDSMRAFRAQTETYYVRTEAGLQPREVAVSLGLNGPLFESATGGLIALRLGGYGEFGAFRQFIDMAQATSLDEFQQVVMRQQLPCFHLVYTGREGNLFYFYNVKTGDRSIVTMASGPEGHPAQAPDWKHPAPLALVHNAWLNPLAAAYCPHTVNPPSGYLQACGGPPWLTMQDTPEGSGAFPPWLVQDEDSMRAVHLRDLLRSGRRTFSDLRALVFDAFAPAAAEIVPRLIELADANPERLANAHPDTKAGVDLMRDWDFVGRPGSRAMTYFQVWWNLLLERMPSAGQSPAGFFTAVQNHDPQADQALLVAASDAAGMLRNVFPDFAPEWGRVHQFQRGAASAPCPGSGSSGALFASDGPLQAGVVQSGPGFAMAVQFGDTPVAYSVVPFGASNRPDSPHFADQLELMSKGRMKRALSREDEVCRYAAQALGREISLLPPGCDAELHFQAAAPIRVRLRVAATPESAFPLGKIPFTPCVTPEVEPADAPVHVTVSVRIPEVLCRRENLPQLAVYDLAEGKGWQTALQVTQNLAEGTLEFQTDGAFAFVVLGPERCLERDAPPPVAVEGETPPGPAPAPQPAPVTTLEVVREHAPEPAENPATRSNVTPAPPEPQATPDLEAPGKLNLPRPRR